MSQLPLVSLIVLNWNGRKHLAACLNSLLELDYPDDRLELLLCDNGSADGSASYVAETFPGIKLVALNRNHGFAEGNNIAAERATGEWVGFLNNDMFVPPGWLQHLVAPLESMPDIACLSSRILNWDGSAIDFVGGGVNFQGHGYQVAYGNPPTLPDHGRRLLFACGGAMLVRRELFLELDGFDPSYFAFFEDIDLGWRLNLLGHDVWYTPEATAYHRHHGTASKIPGHKLKVLYERNALFTIYKCLDDDNLAAALPASLLLINDKALRLANLDYGAWDLGFSEPRVQGISLVKDPDPSAATFVMNVRPPESTLQKAMRITREEGFGVMLRKGAGLARWRYYQIRSRGRMRTGTHGGHPVSNVALAHQIAVREFTNSLGEFTPKRRWLQAHRVRSDAEVLALVPDMIHDPSGPDANYHGFHAWLCEVLGVTERFGGLAGQPPNDRAARASTSDT
jgi:GT2 family glycosyltransferase